MSNVTTAEQREKKAAYMKEYNRNRRMRESNNGHAPSLSEQIRTKLTAIDEELKRLTNQRNQIVSELTTVLEELKVQA